MSTDRYFDKFPVINYSNNNVIDITKRVKFLDKVSRNPYIFYPYDIVGEERADQLSNRYYEDSFKSWILYLSNEIHDPYYGWYLNENQFNEFIEKKYGSIFNATQKIKHYKNDWVSKEDISVSAYNALTNDMKKYWEPNYAGSSVNNYSRKQIDWAASTNKIMSYTVANTSFIQDEVVNIYLDGKSLGRGQFVNASNTQIYVQHVSGSYNESDSLTISNGYIYGTDSNVNTAVTDVVLVTTNIPDDELIYYKAYSYYDYEQELNEYNRSIRVIEKDYSEQIVNNLTTLLEE